MSARAASSMHRPSTPALAPARTRPALRAQPVSEPPVPPRKRRRANRTPAPVDAGLSRLKAVLGGLVLVVLLAGAAVFAVAAAPGAREPVQAGVRTVSVGETSVTVPAGWAPLRVADAGIPDPGGPVAVFAPVPGLSAHAVLAWSPRGLPAPLRELIGPPGRGRASTLAGLPARAYDARQVAGDRTAEFAVARTASGVLSVICLAPSAAWTGAAGCAEQIAPGRAAR